MRACQPATAHCASRLTARASSTERRYWRRSDMQKPSPPGSIARSSQLSREKFPASVGNRENARKRGTAEPGWALRSVQGETHMKSRALLLSGLLSGVFPLSAAAQTAPEQVVVYGTLPDSDIGLAPQKVPGSLQSLDASQISADHGATLLDSLGSQVAGATLSDSQGNSMFEDLRIHGFEA